MKTDPQLNPYDSVARERAMLMASHIIWAYIEALKSMLGAWSWCHSVRLNEKYLSQNGNLNLIIKPNGSAYYMQYPIQNTRDSEGNATYP